ncbi:MAG: glycosyltransferase family 4 protein [Acidobacteriota bacterium]
MKILLFANTDWYLYNFRMSLAEALRAQGHDVVLLSPPGKYTERLERAGFRCVGFRLERRRLNPLAELKTIVELVKVYRCERPELVHHFTVKCVVYGSIAARIASIGAVVNALTGLGLTFSDPRLRMRVLSWIISLMCRLVLLRTQVIFQNPEDQGAFRQHRLVADSASHLIRGSGVDTERFKPRRIVRKTNKRYVLLASRLLWAKGVAEYVEAARLVSMEFPEAVFLIAGESDAGNPDTVPASVIARWKREGNVILLGHCDDMRELIGTVDLVALPTYYGEGVPRILLEAAACGKPLVATRMPGCTEIVHHDENGLLVPPHDSKALAHAIAEILPDDIRCTRLGKHSRQLACEEFAEELVISRTFYVYQLSLLLSRSAMPPHSAPAASQAPRKLPLSKLLPHNPTIGH